MHKEYLRVKHIVDIEVHKLLDGIYEPINQTVEHEIIGKDVLVGDFKVYDTNSEYITITYCELYDVTGISDGEVYENFLDNAHFLGSNFEEVRNSYIDYLIKQVEERLGLNAKDVDCENSVQDLMSKIDCEINNLRGKKH